MDAELIEDALGKQCKKKWWLLWIFFLTSSPGIFNSMHITSYVFLSGDTPFRCDVPQLENAHWTEEQIRNISSPSPGDHSCTMYNWNYTLFEEIGYDSALEFTKTTNKSEIVKCKHYHYLESSPKSTIVSEWDLVCDRVPLRSTVQSAVAIGKFFGAFSFGILADRYGRKKVFSIGCLLYMLVGPITAFVNDYSVFLILRLIIGVAGSGVYEAGYTILTELTVNNYRAFVGCLYNISYSIGFVLLPLAAYYTNNWRNLQWAISLPTVLLLFHIWYTPESPRWLIIQGKVKKVNIGSSAFKTAAIVSKCDNCKMKDQQVIQHSWFKKIFNLLDNFLKLFSTIELTKRILISYFCWFVAQLSYFVLALNGANFTVNQYVYVGLNGLFEAPSYFLPLLVLSFFGRRTTGIALFGITGISLLSIILLPKGMPVVGVAMLGRFTVSAVYAVIILHTSEMFPTSHRNTAIGTSLTMAQLGTIAAPYIVDILGEKAWYIPSTICGSLSLVCSALIFFLPETRGEPLQDTLEASTHSTGRERCPTCLVSN